MSIWGHLAELRRRLTIIVIAVLAGSVVFYFLAQNITFLLFSQIAEYLPNPDNLPPEELASQMYLFEALKPFTFRFYVGFVTSVVVTSPIWLWQIMGFFLPALKPNERKWVVPTFTAMVSLFVLGVLFCYFVILDPAFAFLMAQANGIGNILPQVDNYFDTILLFLMAFGVAFELPVIIFYLTVFNIVPYKKLRQSWRVVYIVLLVLSAFVTPDASPVTMVLMFCALTVLYEGSLLLSRVVLAKRIKANEEREAAEAAAEAAADEAYARRKAAKAAAEAEAERASAISSRTATSKTSGATASKTSGATASKTSGVPVSKTSSSAGSKTSTIKTSSTTGGNVSNKTGSKAGDA